MAYLGDFAVASTVVVRFNTEDPTGLPVTLGGTPAISVYKNSTTQSTAGVTLTVDYDSTTGLQHVAIDTSADGTFYAAGNTFDVVITTGTVNGVSAVGDVVGSFSLNSRVSIANVTALNSSTAAATRIALSAGVIVPGTVTNAGFAPTTTEFECSDITYAATSFYVGRVVIFTSGALTAQAATIASYSLVGGRGHLGVSALTSAPANSVTLIII